MFRVSKPWMVIGVLAVLVVTSFVAYSLNMLTPSIVINTYVGKRPVNAFVQVFAVLPPGHNESLVQVWNGTAMGGVVRVPITVLLGIAWEWVSEGFGGEGVGLKLWLRT